MTYIFIKFNLCNIFFSTQIICPLFCSITVYLSHLVSSVNNYEKVVFVTYLHTFDNFYFLFL
jgi:hypothetical protein